MSSAQSMKEPLMQFKKIHPIKTNYLQDQANHVSGRVSDGGGRRLHRASAGRNFQDHKEVGG